MNRKEHNQTGVFIMSVILVFVFQQMASKIGGFAADLFDYSSMDPDNAYLWITVHHIVQMVFASLAILLLRKKLGLDFGLKIKADQAGTRYLLVFLSAIIGYVMISYLAGYASHRIALDSYELNPRNVLGTMGFQLLLSTI